MSFTFSQEFVQRKTEKSVKLLVFEPRYAQKLCFLRFDYRSLIFEI